MASRQLEYIVSLRDQLTPEISKISREMDRLGGQGQKAIGRIALGAAGLYGIGASVMSGLQPAIEMNNELGKIKGLGESAEGLELLQKRALSFSTQWGESAAEFVDASYDIKSAIDGLSAEELVSFTEISAVTGKATQTSGKIMTDYLGTMYSVLGASKEADKISWAKTLMAQTAYTANKFKSDGAKIAQAFSTLGNQATLAGVKVNEQFAILGTLQNEMGGGESATKYSAFLSSIGEAGDKLGMNFRDVNGILKSTPEILQMLKRKYGDVIDDRESAELKKALGRKEGLDFIKALIGKVDELGGSITEIGKINGLNEVKAGAVANIDVFKRLQAVVKGIQIAIGNQLLKVLDPFLQKIADVGSYLVDWFTANKYIARLVGLVLGGVAAVAALASAVTMLTGLFALVKVGVAIFGALAVPVAILALKIGAVMGFIYLFRAQIEKFVSGFMAGFNAIGVSFEPLKQAFGELFTRIGQIAARLSGSGEAWDGWAALGRVAGGLLAIALNTIITGLEFIINIASTVLDVFVDVFDGISYTWQTVSEAFTNEGIFAAFEALGDGVTKMFTNIMESILRGIINMINTAIGWVNKLGSNIDPIELPVRLRTNDINATTSTAGITGTVLNLAQSATNNTVKVEGTNAKALTQPKSGKGVAGQITQNKTAHIVNHINIHGADAGTQANNYVNAQERAQLGA
ncbi:phage tail tape measure protein [Haemophilus parahaemolyticus]|uniref:phage tail tape measure protein n=1 Tax=Haemophilus parahaemolyticus TaxID=735 RepID=UPI0028E6FAAD|nr:phage tail tape measure protein [Haemophilus parahaemolyticus]